MASHLTRRMLSSHFVFPSAPCIPPLTRLPSHRYAMMSASSPHNPPPPTPSSPASPSRLPQTSASKETAAQAITKTSEPNLDLSPDAAFPQIAARPPPAPKAERPKPKIRATKAAIVMKPAAVERLRMLMKSPTPQHLRIGVRNKGCAGLSYNLEYVDNPGRFDEVVEQDGVKVLIDSKALFSIIGSEMDWQEDALSAKFAFKNPNIKDACGCGESFTVES